MCSDLQYIFRYCIVLLENNSAHSFLDTFTTTTMPHSFAVLQINEMHKITSCNREDAHQDKCQFHVSCMQNIYILLPFKGIWLGGKKTIPSAMAFWDIQNHYCAITKIPPCIYRTVLIATVLHICLASVWACNLNVLKLSMWYFKNNLDIFPDYVTPPLQKKTICSHRNG